MSALATVAVRPASSACRLATVARCAWPSTPRSTRRPTPSATTSGFASRRPTPWASCTTPSYLPYLEEARVAYLRAIGHPYHEVRAAGADFAVLEVFVRYLQPLRFDEIVRVHLLLAVASRATFQMGYLLEIDGQARATAVTVHGCVDPTGRPVRMPSWLSEMAQTTG